MHNYRPQAVKSAGGNLIAVEKRIKYPLPDAIYDRATGAVNREESVRRQKLEPGHKTGLESAMRF